MNCPKCNQPMKEYLGLKETGWDCVNADCGKDKGILAGARATISIDGEAIAKSDDVYESLISFVYPSFGIDYAYGPDKAAYLPLPVTNWFEEQVTELESKLAQLSGIPPEVKDAIATVERHIYSTPHGDLKIVTDPDMDEDKFRLE